MRSKVIGYGWGLLLLSGCQIGMGPPSYIPERALQPSITVPVISPALTSPVPSPSVSVGGGVTVPLQPAPSATPAGNNNQPSSQASSSTASSPVMSSVLSGSGSSGGSASNAPVQQLMIANVTLADNGLSILGTDAPGAIVPDYAGESLTLRLTGSFRNPQLQPLQLQDFAFTPDPQFAPQTFLGDSPMGRMILDESLLLTPVSVSATEIKVLLNPKYVPDLYLKGMHRLRVEHGNWYTDALIKIGDPVPPPTSLAPGITQVEVVRQNDEPRFVKLTGSHFMIYPKFSHATIDGEFGFGYHTRVDASGQFETLIHIPNPESFDTVSPHLIIYTTPYGVAFYEF